MKGILVDLPLEQIDRPDEVGDELVLRVLVDLLRRSDLDDLTGIHDEAGAALLLAPGERTYREYLFLASRDQD